MRGEDQRSEGFFSYVRLESRIPADHPLRAIRGLVDAALGELSRSFDRLYSRDGRPSIPPERLLRALLLQAFYTVRSERQLMDDSARGRCLADCLGLFFNPFPLRRRCSTSRRAAINLLPRSSFFSYACCRTICISVSLAPAISTAMLTGICPDSTARSSRCSPL